MNGSALVKQPSLARTARRRALAALAAAALLAGCGPSHDAPANAGQASSRAQQSGPAAVAVARGKIEVEGGLLDLSPAVAGVVQQLSVKEGQPLQRGQLLQPRQLLQVFHEGLPVVHVAPLSPCSDNTWSMMSRPKASPCRCCTLRMASTPLPLSAISACAAR